MSLSIRETYDQKAKASTQMIRNEIVLHVPYVKSMMPKVEAVIEIGVESIKENQIYMQRVAAIRLDNSSDDSKLKLNVSVYKYESLPEPEVKQSPSQFTNQLALSDSESKEKKSENTFSVLKSLISTNNSNKALIPSSVPLISAGS